MCLRLVNQGKPPPGVRMQEEELDVADEPPGGLWEVEGMLGPGEKKEEDLEWFTQALARGAASEAGGDQLGEQPEVEEHF